MYLTKSERKVALRVLANKYLNINIQGAGHSATEDAKAAFGLAKLYIEILRNFEVG